MRLEKKENDVVHSFMRDEGNFFNNYTRQKRQRSRTTSAECGLAGAEQRLLLASRAHRCRRKSESALPVAGRRRRLPLSSALQSLSRRFPHEQMIADGKSRCAILPLYRRKSYKNERSILDRNSVVESIR